MELSLKVIQDLGNMKIVSGYKNRLEYLLNKAERVFILLNDIKSSPYTLIYNYYDILTDEDSGSYKRLDILREFLNTLSSNEEIDIRNATAYYDLARRCNYTFTTMWSKITTSIAKPEANMTDDEVEIVKKLNKIMAVLTVKIPLLYIDNMGYEECQRYMRNFNIRLTEQDKEDIDIVWEIACVTMSWYNIVVSLSGKSSKWKDILYDMVLDSNEEFCERLLEGRL